MGGRGKCLQDAHKSNFTATCHPLLGVFPLVLRSSTENNNFLSFGNIVYLQFNYLKRDIVDFSGLSKHEPVGNLE